MRNMIYLLQNKDLSRDQMVSPKD